MRKLFTGVAAAVLLLFGTATASASTSTSTPASAPGGVGVAGHGNLVCDFGEACLFAWPNFTGPTWDANGCGWHLLDGWMQNQTSSAITHGNAITLWNWNDYDSQPDHWVPLVKLPAWSHADLGNVPDMADAITVHC